MTAIELLLLLDRITTIQTTKVGTDEYYYWADHWKRLWGLGTAHGLLS